MCRAWLKIRIIGLSANSMRTPVSPEVIVFWLLNHKFLPPLNGGVFIFMTVFCIIKIYEKRKFSRGSIKSGKV